MSILLQHKIMYIIFENYGHIIPKFKILFYKIYSTLVLIQIQKEING